MHLLVIGVIVIKEGAGHHRRSGSEGLNMAGTADPGLKVT